MTLPPGPELDRCVAEAMGLRCETWGIEGRESLWLIGQRYRGSWQPSTDRAQAFTVALDWLLDQCGNSLTLELSHTHATVGADWPGGSFHVDGDTPAHALCLAVLAAKET